ncbi:MAG TPA: metal-dependent hydrolase, partial [Thermoplasmata archaeon]
MDPFTHFLLGYLITFGVWGPGQIQYVVAGALAGGLPDADVIFYPLSRRFPALRHRGLSHSIVGVTIIAVVGVFAVPPVLASVLGASYGVGSPLLFFVALEAGGLS